MEAGAQNTLKQLSDCHAWPERDLAYILLLALKLSSVPCAPVLEQVTRE